MKIDLAYDLLAGTIISHSLQAATTQDKTIGRELVTEIRRGDLVLRDMGYFSLGEFTAIEACGAWWLTRLPLTTGVLLENGNPLEKLLEIRRHTIHDIGVIVGEQGKKCRLIAALFDFDPYPDHVMRDKRRRQFPVESGIQALT